MAKNKGGINLHSTLIKYKVPWDNNLSLTHTNLHSTLIKYKVLQKELIYLYIVLIYIPL